MFRCPACRVSPNHPGHSKLGEGPARATPSRCRRGSAIGSARVPPPRIAAPKTHTPHVRHPDLRTARILVARDRVRRHRHSVVRQLAPLARQAHRCAGSRAGVGCCSGQGAAGRGAGGASRRPDSRQLRPGTDTPSTQLALVGSIPPASPSILTAPAACPPTGLATPALIVSLAPALSRVPPYRSLPRSP